MVIAGKHNTDNETNHEKNKVIEMIFIGHFLQIHEMSAL